MTNVVITEELPEELIFVKAAIIGYEADGKTSKEISSILNICSKTTRNHISNSIIKLGVKNRTQAIILLVKNGLLEI